MSIYHPNPFSLYIKDSMNDLCKDCKWNCKQSKAVDILSCPQFEEKKRWDRIEQEAKIGLKIDLDLLVIDK